MFRIIELVLLVVCLVAVGIIVYGYMRPWAERRKAEKQRSLERQVAEFLKQERKE